MKNYEEFKTVILDTLKDYMGEDFDEHELTVVKVNRNGRLKEGISFRKKFETREISPTIYLEDMYESYLSSRDIEIECVKAANLLIRGSEHGKELLTKLDPTNIKNNICFQLIPQEGNHDFLEDIPHRNILDLAICYRWVIDIDKRGYSSSVIDTKLMESMNFDEEELYKLSMDNTPRLFPTRLMTLEDMVDNYRYGRLIDEDLNEVDVSLEGDTVLVLTNKSCVHGAGTMMYKGVLEDISNRFGTGLYILPSSIDEILIVGDCRFDPYRLLNIISEVNYQDLTPDKKLSDNLYHFDKETSQIALVNNLKV